MLRSLLRPWLLGVAVRTLPLALLRPVGVPCRPLRWSNSLITLLVSKSRPTLPFEFEWPVVRFRHAVNSGAAVSMRSLTLVVRVHYRSRDRRHNGLLIRVAESLLLHWSGDCGMLATRHVVCTLLATSSEAEA